MIAQNVSVENLYLIFSSSFIYNIRFLIFVFILLINTGDESGRAADQDRAHIAVCLRAFHSFENDRKLKLLRFGDGSPFNSRRVAAWCLGNKPSEGIPDISTQIIHFDETINRPSNANPTQASEREENEVRNEFIKIPKIVFFLSRVKFRPFLHLTQWNLREISFERE